MTEDFDDDPRNYEPECTCRQVDVDLVDASFCELCNTDSDWNRARDRADEAPAIAPIEQNLGDIVCSDDDAPF